MKCTRILCYADHMAVTWAALGLMALVSFGFMGLVWSKVDALGSEFCIEIGQVRSEIGQVRREIGRLGTKIDALGRELRQHPATA